MSKAEVLLVGMIHMAVEPSHVNEEKDEVVKAQQLLERFEPTKVAVEKSYYVEEEMNRRFKAYRSGEIAPAYDEVEQLGFPVAKTLDHQQLYAVDEVIDMSSPTIDGVFEWAKQYQPTLFQDIMKLYQLLLEERQKEASLLGKIKAINDAKYLQTLRKVYMKIAQVGDRQQRVGVNWLKQWHHRDLAIAANILKIAQPGERILIIIGGDHLPLLQQFLSESDEVELTSLSHYI
ncbi:DUF5694 domain-containing protein [Halobacillus salinus]|uniref:DUF5694 domain-containing protein n=1 Tax=Halobacillus salinus TaxID=192814 RepID=UPI0009A840B1|nr:DUF5694 domain-containing protein [Halobacillus salinus]